jgi:hypothetical protein
MLIHSTGTCLCASKNKRTWPPIAPTHRPPAELGSPNTLPPDSTRTWQPVQCPGARYHCPEHLQETGRRLGSRRQNFLPVTDCPSIDLFVRNNEALYCSRVLLIARSRHVVHRMQVAVMMVRRYEAPNGPRHASSIMTFCCCKRRQPAE